MRCKRRRSLPGSRKRTWARGGELDEAEASSIRQSSRLWLRMEEKCWTRRSFQSTKMRKWCRGRRHSRQHGDFTLCPYTYFTVTLVGLLRNAASRNNSLPLAFHHKFLKRKSQGRQTPRKCPRELWEKKKKFEQKKRPLSVNHAGSIPYTTGFTPR